MTDSPANAPDTTAPAAPNPFQPRTFLLPAGNLEFSPAARHHIIMHAGAPVATRRSLDGKTQYRMRLAGDFDVVPCGMAGRWRNEGEIELLLIEVDQRFAESVSDREARIGGLRPGLKLRDPHLHQLTLALSADDAGLSGAGRVYCESILTAILARLMFLQNGRSDGDNGKRSQMALRQQQRLIDYIESNLSEVFRSRRSPHGRDLACHVSRHSSGTASAAPLTPMSFSAVCIMPASSFYPATCP